jgi:bifunctional non-homologous end joining protein LigD
MVARSNLRVTPTLNPLLIEGAKAAAPFGFIEPSHPTLVDQAPSGPDWVHEIKHDGYRVQAHVREGEVTIYTRRGYDWTGRFRSVADALARIPARNVVLDGEIVVPGERGLSDFGALEADLGAGRSDRFVCYLFELLYLDGFDLRRAPLIARKEALRDLLERAPASRHLVYSEHLEEEGPAVVAHGCEIGVEGIISKQRSSPYRSGRNRLWIKTKCVHTDTFPIVGFVEKLGARPPRIAALYLGRSEGRELLYAGKAAICGQKIELDEIARELGWDDVTASLICAKGASIRGNDEPEEDPPRGQ